MVHFVPGPIPTGEICGLAVIKRLQNAVAVAEIRKNRTEIGQKYGNTSFVDTSPGPEALK